MHKDKAGKPLTEGFYRDDSPIGFVVYFTGKETAGGGAIVEGYDGLSEELSVYTSEITCRLSPMDLSEDLSELFEEQNLKLKSNQEWVERKQSQLELIAKAEADRTKTTSSPITPPDSKSQGSGEAPYLEDDIPF